MASTPPRKSTAAGTEPTLGELVATATKDMSDLVHQEIALAKAELKREAVTAGKGAGLLGAAGIAALLGWVFLMTSAAYGISWLGVPLGCAWFTVGALHLGVAGFLALRGKRSVGGVGAPEKTVQTLKDDLAWARHPTRTPTASSARDLADR